MLVGSAGSIVVPPALTASSTAHYHRLWALVLLPVGPLSVNLSSLWCSQRRVVVNLQGVFGHQIIHAGPKRHRSSPRPPLSAPQHMAVTATPPLLCTFPQSHNSYVSCFEPQTPWRAYLEYPTSSRVVRRSPSLISPPTPFLCHHWHHCFILRRRKLVRLARRTRLLG